MGLIYSKVDLEKKYVKLGIKHGEFNYGRSKLRVPRKVVYDFLRGAEIRGAEVGTTEIFDLYDCKIGPDENNLKDEIIYVISKFGPLLIDKMKATPPWLSSILGEGEYTTIREVETLDDVTLREIQPMVKEGMANVETVRKRIKILDIPLPGGPLYLLEDWRPTSCCRSLLLESKIPIHASHFFDQDYDGFCINNITGGV